MQLRGPDEARVGQGHGKVGVLAKQPPQPGALSHDGEIHPKKIAQEEVDEAPHEVLAAHGQRPVPCRRVRRRGR